ncbi:MAG TPA: L-histidine N(alpha)-methyltransferase [Balneolales bacterium]|nr:L-histidine N(alpha)-methyltransferase [Balneolales bacterium]
MKDDAVSIQEDDLKEVINGLSQPQKQLPSKLFYDERGSRLFDQICELDEYYPTRTESKILIDNRDDILSYFDENALLIELGSGSSTKTRLLLDSLNSLSAYIPIDISEEFLYKTAERLRLRYPDLRIIPYSTDYTHPFNLPELDFSFSKKIVFYPGSTIGNFTPGKARHFLTLVSDIIGENGGLLIGVDLKKDPKILEAAYNDAEGITGEFNINILRRLNEEFDATFDLDQFEHQAVFNEKEGRIEMHLISKKNQTVSVRNNTFFFSKGESIHTENSYKYTLKEFRELVEGLFEVEKVWTDENQLFSLQYLKSMA